MQKTQETNQGCEPFGQLSRTSPIRLHEAAGLTTGSPDRKRISSPGLLATTQRTAPTGLVRRFGGSALPLTGPGRQSCSFSTTTTGSRRLVPRRMQYCAGSLSSVLLGCRSTVSAFKRTCRATALAALAATAQRCVCAPVAVSPDLTCRDHSGSGNALRPFMISTTGMHCIQCYRYIYT